MFSFKSIKFKRGFFSDTKVDLPPPKGGASLEGFTLVEVLVALTIFSIIALTIGGTFISGMKIWSKANKTTSFNYEVFLTGEEISKEILESIDISLIGFKGTEREITFAFLKNSSVVEVTYVFEPQQKALWRKERTLEDVIDGEDNYKEKKILSLEDFNFDFFYFDKDKEAYMWKNSWSKEDGMPLAVSFKMNTENGILKKTLFIPLS